MACMADEADSRSFVIISDDEDYCCLDYALSHPSYKSAILLLAKLRVIYALQRVWRLQLNLSIMGKPVIDDQSTSTSTSYIKCKFSYSKFCVAVGLQRRWRCIANSYSSPLNILVFQQQLESLSFLHQTLLGIRTVFNAGVYSLMKVVYTHSIVPGSSSNLICPLVCQEISFCCVRVTHFLSSFSSVSFHQATQKLPLPLDEQLTNICHGWLPLVAHYLDSITYTLSNLNLHSYSIDDVPQIFRAAYLEASSIDKLMRNIIESLDYIIKSFKDNYTSACARRAVNSDFTPEIIITSTSHRYNQTTNNQHLIYNYK
jgi:hypothetical protein